MKKAFDQTLRDIKREVNKKVLKVPSIEQKVLDATSNEPWGPHGSLLADIAMATRNYHEYQMIMAVIWKRLSDTGKNWRHVYKGLTVLEYLVAHGSERVIDEIREHGYQISALSDFQYIDSSGRDQGNNVRRKSQGLVLLVNDKERIQEVRQKAVTNRDKYRNSTAADGMYKPGSGGYGDDRYGSREDERNGYGRDREWGYKDDEKYGRYRDLYSNEGDRYGRDSEDHYGREYRDDGFRGRSPSVDDNHNGTRSRSSEGNGGRAYDDDDHRSSRGSSIKPEDHSQDGRPMERKFSEQSLSTPPSYEEAVGDSRSPAFSERGGETVAASAPQSSPGITAATVPQLSSPNANVAPQSSVPVINQTVEVDAFNEFDPRGSVSAAPRTSNNAEMDLFGPLSDVFSANPLAIMPAPPVNGDLEADSMKVSSNAPFGVAASQNQSFEDSFGDSPFKAIPSDNAPTQIQNFTSMPSSSFQPPVKTVEQTNPAFQNLDPTVNNNFTNPFPGVNFDPTNVPNTQIVPSPQYPPQEAPTHDDILAGILPISHPTTVSDTPFSAPNGFPQAISPQTSFPSATSQHFAAEPTLAPYPQPAQNMAATSTQLGHQSFLPSYAYQATGLNSNGTIQAQTGSLSRQSSDFLGDLLPQTGSTISSQYGPNSVDPLALVPQASKEKEKFEPKSTVWADTLSKGLVDLNISGSKCNPLADIGIDFESLNRKEKRMEKPSSTAPTTSTVSMGKAMGSGSGIGRASAVAMRPPPNPMMAAGMGMGGGPGIGMGVGMGGYGSMNQPPMGMGMGMNGMGAGQGMQMQPPNGFGPPNMNNYNPMMGRGGYSQQPYGGGYHQ